jgi:hypothetical protein
MRADIRRIDLLGKRFGQLTVIAPAEPAFRGQRTRPRWLARCDCGTEIVRFSLDLRRGDVRSCGCQKGQWIREARTTHGVRARGGTTPEYDAWQAMHARCSTEREHLMPRYAGRGIRVCERWSGPTGFPYFFSDMGRKPSPSHSLDRFPDNDGDYEPGNCRWATRAEQASNTSSTRVITFNGVTMTMTQWAAHVGVTPSTMVYRLKNWTIRQALTP